MRALVVYESMFGNTETIARAIADGLSSHVAVEITEVGRAPTEIGDDVSLLVAGGPTHAFGMSRPSTRQDAAKQAGGPVVSARIGLREWVEGLHPGRPLAAATFDTRVAKPRVPGSAARAAHKQLRRRGFTSAGRAETFYVTGTPGPLLDGEETRARTWGGQLGERLAAAKT